MKASGKTPLLRARNIEKKLGLKRIYIKLEGTNPTGAKQDRLAKQIILMALKHNYSNILVEGSKPYLKSMSYYAKILNAHLVVPQFKHQKWKSKLGNHIKLLDYKTKNRSKNYRFYEDLSSTFQAYIAIENMDHFGLQYQVYQEIGKEILKKINHPIDSLFYTHQVDYQDSLMHVFTTHSIDQNFDAPTVYALDDHHHQLSDELIHEAYLMLSGLEHLKLKDKNAIPFAKFLDELQQNHIQKGHHVIVLDKAKTKVDIERLTSFDDISKNQLLQYIDQYLDQYADSRYEVSDALDNAIEQGYILMAYKNEAVDGICIVVHTNFDQFIPSYHLAYIGTNPNSKGRGLGTRLIEYAVDLTDGDISLHVDLDNYRAKKLYEKMGFKHVYNRMIFKNNDE